MPRCCRYGCDDVRDEACLYTYVKDIKKRNARHRDGCIAIISHKQRGARSAASLRLLFHRYLLPDRGNRPRNIAQSIPDF
ncbi:hypothetical protein PISMIDRAFT_690168, partial [Pisolithus microcarpus 441]